MSAPSPDARLALRPEGTRGHGHDDGAWWPHSTDLAAELPGLVAALDQQGVRIARIAYSLGTWGEVPRRVAAGGRTVRTGGFRVIDPLLVSLTPSAGGEPVDLRVVPPDTSPEDAAADLLAAGERAEDGRRPVPGPRAAAEPARRAVTAPGAGHPPGRPA